MLVKSLQPSEGGVLLLGGRSEIGIALASRLSHGRPVVLAQRPSHKDVGARDNLLRGGAQQVYTLEWDALQSNDLTSIYERAEKVCGMPVSTIIAAFGVLGNQRKAEHDPAEVFRIAHTDYTTQAVTMTAAVEYLRKHTHGLLVAFSSIAGQRVRRKNYVYGSAKAGLDGFLSGLIDATHKEKVNVVMARPGFVIGRMTAGMSPTIMSSTAEQVASEVYQAIRAGKHRVWIPARLRVLAGITPLVPQWLWRQLPR